MTLKICKKCGIFIFEGQCLCNCFKDGDKKK